MLSWLVSVALVHDAEPSKQDAWLVLHPNNAKRPEAAVAKATTTCAHWCGSVDDHCPNSLCTGCEMCVARAAGASCTRASGQDDKVESCRSWCSVRHASSHCSACSCKACDFCVAAAQAPVEAKCTPFDKFDSMVRGCATFCKQSFASAHCPRCQCGTCAFCARSPPPPPPVPATPFVVEAAAAAPAPRVDTGLPQQGAWEYYHRLLPLPASPPPSHLPGPPQGPSPPPPMAASPFLPVLADAVNPFEVLVNPAVVPSAEQGARTSASDASAAPSTVHGPMGAKKPVDPDLEQWIPALVLFALIAIGIALGSRASSASSASTRSGGGAGARAESAGASLMAQEEEDDGGHSSRHGHRRAQRADDELLARAVKRQHERGKVQIL